MGERFIKLNGDAVNVPLHKSFHRSSAIQTTGLLFAFNCAATITTQVLSPIHGLTFIAGTVGSYAFAEYIVRKMENRTFRRHFPPGSNKCIDTAPTEKTPPTAPKDYSSAKKCLKDYSEISVGMLLIGSLHAILDNKSIGQEWVDTVGRIMTDPYLAPLGALSLTLLSRFSLNTYRFYKVVKGDYAIVATPPPEKLKAQKTDLAFNPT